MIHTYRLGKLPKQEDARNLRLARYVDHSTLRTIPLSRAHARPLRGWTMGANNRVGCCAIVALAHGVQSWNAANGLSVTPSDEEILSAYAAISGWDGSAATDRGATMLAALKHARTWGVGGHKILAFAEIDPHDHATMAAACDWFGGLYVGAQLPVSAQTTGLWSNTSDGEVWGGHAMWLHGRSPYIRKLATWSRDQSATLEWCAQYADEVYAVISEEWLGSDLISPDGLDLAGLLADLQTVTR